MNAKVIANAMLKAVRTDGAGLRVHAIDVEAGRSLCGILPASGLHGWDFARCIGAVCRACDSRVSDFAGQRHPRT
jgi:hypothetical protein